MRTRTTMFCVPPVSGSTPVTPLSHPALQRSLVVVVQGRQALRVVGHADIVSGLARRQQQVLPFHGAGYCWCPAATLTLAHSGDATAGRQEQNDSHH